MTARISPILVARELCERSRQLRMEGVIARSNAECELAETRMANARIQERSKTLLRRAPSNPYRGVRRMTIRYENLTKQKRPERPYDLPQSASVLLPPSPDGESGSTSGAAVAFSIAHRTDILPAHTEESG